jgi:chromosome condensin MukBEF MukE localization factor
MPTEQFPSMTFRRQALVVVIQGRYEVSDTDDLTGVREDVEEALEALRRLGMVQVQYSVEEWTEEGPTPANG